MIGRTWIFGLLLFAIPSTALSASGFGYRGWGPRVGITMDPDQVHFGFHLDYGGLGEGVRFQPNFEFGVGDNQTLGAINFEAAYQFLTSRSSWNPYVGGDLGLNVVGNDDRHFEDRNSEVGLSAVGGIERGLSSGDRLFTEVKLGLVDAPDLKLTVGWTMH